MTLYIIKRLGMAILVVVLSMIFLALLVHIVPGDPVKIILGPRASDALSQLVRHEMELDQPVHIQVWHFLTNGLQGDLGNDFASQLPVTEIIGSALPHTVILSLASLILATGAGVPLGIYAASHPGTWVDRVLGTVSVALITVPAFVAGLVLLLIFSVQLDMLPAVGAGSLSDPADYARHLILPAVALSISWMGYLARLVRLNMLEVLGAPYIRTAHAYGLRQRVIFFRYALKNAIIPTVAVLGFGLGNLIGSAVFVEVIFSRPGLGTVLVDSIQTRNFPIVRGAVLVVTILVVLANLIADLSYRFLDPRIRLETREN